MQRARDRGRNACFKPTRPSEPDLRISRIGCDRVYSQLRQKRVCSINVGSSLAGGHELVESVKTAADRLMHDGLHK